MGNAILRSRKRIVASLVMPHKRDGKSAVISADGLNGDGTFAVMSRLKYTDGKMPSSCFQMVNMTAICRHSEFSSHLLLQLSMPKTELFSWVFFKFLLPEQIKKPVTYTTAPAGWPSPRWCSFWFVYVTGFVCINQTSLFSWRSYEGVL